MDRRELVIPWAMVKDFMDENKIVGTKRHINKYLDLIQSFFLGQRICSVRELANLLSLSRLTVERRFLQENLPHYDVVFGVEKNGEVVRKSAPRDRLYIVSRDLMDYLVSVSDLIYEQNTMELVPFVCDFAFKDLLSRPYKKCSSVLVHRRIRYSVKDFSEGQIRVLEDLLFDGFWSTQVQLVEATKRSRSSMVLLGYMTDSVLIPQGGKAARRILVHGDVPPHVTHIESMLRMAFKYPILSHGMVFNHEPLPYV